MPEAENKKIGEFLLKKWEKVFNTFFDVNGTKDMDWGDFYLVTRRVRNIYGNESEQMSFARSALRALWDGLLSIADRDHSQKIELAEWIALIDQSDADNIKQWFLDYMRFMFKLMNVAANGSLNEFEYTDGMAIYGFTPEQAHAAFKKFAVDSHNKPLRSVDFGHYKKLWLDYYYSTDQNAPGNHLFGVLE